MPDADETRRLLERQALGYRNQAEEFRTVHAGTVNPVARRALIRLADSADRMAAQVERELATLKQSSLRNAS